MSHGFTMRYGFGINGSIEQLDYTVHLTMGDHEECVRFFAEHPVYGTVGYASYEDAEDDYHGYLGVGQFIETCEAMINAGYDGDHFYFDRQDMLIKVRNDYHFWTWTPETGIVYDPEPEPEICPNRKQRRSARRKQNARHKVADRLHGKGTYVYHYKENGELKEAISGNEYRNWATWVRTMHSWGDPEGKKRRIPRTQSVSVHKDTVPVPEQEPTYVGFYGTLEIRKGINVTMEWNIPEAVQGEPV